MRTLLLDADSIVYQVACAASAPIDFGDGVLCEQSDSLDNCKRSLDIRIQGFAELLEADRIIVCLTDKVNFRKALYPEYKANRKGKPLPPYLAELRTYLHEAYEVYQRPGLEADDVCGILATDPELVPGEKIVVSIDKDFLSVPCNLFNPQQAAKGVQVITEEMADRWHMYQTLTGDSCDNYPGCKGIGPKKANMVLDAVDRENWWPCIVALFRGLSGLCPLTQARVARILRASDYDFTRKQPILWNPA